MKISSSHSVQPTKCAPHSTEISEDYFSKSATPSIKTMLLPHESSSLYFTDGGLETSLIYLKGIPLPCFAACSLLQTTQGCDALHLYYSTYLRIATKYQTGFILESPTWRASMDWITALGYPSSALQEINTKGIQMMKQLKQEYHHQLHGPIVISGCIGPRGDGYHTTYQMDSNTAQQYHSTQIQLFKTLGVDVVSAFTLNYLEEAMGIVQACQQVQIPCVISFTLETNGMLPSGMSVKEAIETIDRVVKTPPIYYMINCAHPTHFVKVLQDDKDAHWVKRIRGIRANASCKSHAELDHSTTLDRGNIEEFSAMHKLLKQTFPLMNVFGGCCGTDEEHVESIFQQLQSA